MRLRVVLTAVAVLIAGQSASSGPAAEPETIRVLADQRLEEALRAIAGEFEHRKGITIELRFAPVEQVESAVAAGAAGCDVVFSIAPARDAETVVSRRPGAQKVAWRYPNGEPVSAAALSKRDAAADLVRFAASRVGHRLWAEARPGYVPVSGKNRAEAFQWIVEHRVGHTYAATALRMLGELGGIREGVCIDIGCGSGNLAVELARRSKFKIVGLDIDPDARPYFEKTVRAAGFEDRISFVEGDAQKLPFPDDSADVIVSRGTLVFIPDIGKCLKEVDRVLKPTGVAFLGGRYLFTPQPDRKSIDELREIVAKAAIPGAEVIDSRGQWVKIVGREAPPQARQSQQGPETLAARCAADYDITDGTCLLLCGSDGALEQGLQRGFLELTRLQITALYPKQEMADQAAERLRAASADRRVRCKVGTVHQMPMDDASFDLIVGVGPILLWGDREQGMREIYRVLRPDGAALVGGRFVHMPEGRKVSSETLRQSAARTGIPSIRVLDDRGQWIEILK